MRGLPLTGFPIGFTGAFLSTWALSSFMYSETLEFVSITLVLAVLTALLSAFLPQKTSQDAMKTMVGGTAGGLLGGLLVLALMPSHCGGHSMTVMTDSMAGMIGCTLGQWQLFS